MYSGRGVFWQAVAMVVPDIRSLLLLLAVACWSLIICCLLFLGLDMKKTAGLSLGNVYWRVVLCSIITQYGTVLLGGLLLLNLGIPGTLSERPLTPDECVLNHFVKLMLMVLSMILTFMETDWLVFRGKMQQRIRTTFCLLYSFLTGASLLLFSDVFMLVS